MDGCALVRVASRIGGPDGEGVRAVGEAAVALGARAGREAAAVELAGESGAGLARGEGEARRRVVARVAGGVRDGRVRRGRVDRPGEGGRTRVRIAGRVGGADGEGVAAWRERAVRLRARAGREAAAVEL